MHFSSASDASGRDEGRPLKKKKPYIPPKATVVSPDQAEKELRAKVGLQSQEFEACSELIAEARKRQEGRRSRGVSSSTGQT